VEMCKEKAIDEAGISKKNGEKARSRKIGRKA